MKTFMKTLIAMMLVIASLLTFASCGKAPASNLEDAKDALEDEDYTVYYEDEYDDEEDPSIKEILSASNDKDDRLYIVVFNDMKSAQLRYSDLKREYKNEKDELKAEIKYYEHLLKKYDDDLKNDVADEIEDEIKDLEDELEEMEDFIIGWNWASKTVWYGTENAVKASKG